MENTSEFVYVGSCISENCELDAEIKQRLGKARAVFSRLWSTVWGVKQLQIKTKVHVYKSCVLSTLLYGSETWAIRPSHIKMLQKFHMGCVRWIIGVSRRQQHDKSINNEKLLEMCKGCIS